MTKTTDEARVTDEDRCADGDMPAGLVKEAGRLFDEAEAMGIFEGAVRGIRGTVVSMMLDAGRFGARVAGRTLADRLAAREATLDRLSTVIGEAFGLQPVQTAEDLVSTLERLLFEDRQKWNAREAERAEMIALLERAPLGGTDAEVIAFVDARAEMLKKLRGAP